MISADGQGLKRVTHDLAGQHRPAFSPDGKRIAYMARHEESLYIYVVEADGRNRVRLTHNQEHHRDPAWSPDGGAIAYASSDDLLFDAKIHLMTADGEYLKQLSKVRHGTDYQPDISPLGLAVFPASNKSTICGRLKKTSSGFR